MQSAVGRSILAGLAYWAVLFGVGFVLGTLRVLLIEPNLGAIMAVMLELPVMLAVCWLTARWLVRRWRLTIEQAAVAGGIALFLLMAAEAATAAAFFGEAPAQWLAGLVDFPAALGLVAQLLAATLPALFSARLGGNGDCA